MSGTAEYQLPADFIDMAELTDGLNTTATRGKSIPFLPVSKALAYSGDTLFAYLKGRYIGFVPTPTVATAYYYRYRKGATRLTSLSDYIDLPDGAFYALKSWMLFRAKQKFSDPASAMFYSEFSDQINLYVQSSVKRDPDLASWDIGSSSNT